MNNRVFRRIFYTIIVVIMFILIFFIESSDSLTLETIGGVLIYHLILPIFSLLLTSCVTYDNLYNGEKVPSEHEVTFKVEDVNGNPIEGINLMVKSIGVSESDVSSMFTSMNTQMIYSENIYDMTTNEKFDYYNQLCNCLSLNTYTTNESGEVFIPVSTRMIDSNFGTHISIVDYESSLGEYFTGNTSNTFQLISSPVLNDPTLNQSKNETITLYKKEDFLSEDFDNEVLKGQVLDLLDYLYSQGILEGNNLLKPFSIDYDDFRGSNNLTFVYQNFSVFNSVKLTKYEVVSRVFDESIRKQLNPLNDFLSEQESIDGYSISVNTSYKNFTDDEEIPEELLVTFHIDKNDIKEYKDFDITGQELLNRSFIILDGERIDLRLQ